jgi:hypothetical protein
MQTSLKNKSLFLFLIVLLGSGLFIPFLNIQKVYAQTPSFTETWISFEATGTGWQDYDIYTNDAVPKGAVASILLINEQANAEQNLGVRTDGSSLDRYVDVHEAEQGGVTGYTMDVLVDATSGYIETYCESTTGSIFYVTGYWENVDFTELFDSHVFSSPQQNWNNEDISGDGVPSNATVQILTGEIEPNWYNDMGFREDGSSLVRYFRVHESEGGGGVYYSTYVKASNSSIIESYVRYRSSPTRYWYVVGYYDEDDLDFVEGWTEDSETTDSSWEEWDLTANLDEDGRTVVVIATNEERTTENIIGVRGGDSSTNRYYDEHEAESYGEMGATFIANSDSNGVIDIYGEDVSYNSFYFAGYFIPSAGAVPYDFELTESFSLSASLYTKKTIIAVLSEILSLNVDLETQKALLIELEELLNLNSDLERIRGVVALLNEVLSLDTSLESIKDIFKVLSEVLVEVASLESSKELSRVLSEVFAVTDSFEVEKAIFVLLSEIFSLTSSLEDLKEVLASLLEVVVLTSDMYDQKSIISEISEILFATLPISANLETQKEIYALITETLNLVDSLEAKKSLIALLNEVLSLDTSLESKKDILALISDVLSLEGSTSARKNLLGVLVETLNLNASVEDQKDIFRLIAEVLLFEASLESEKSIYAILSELLLLSSIVDEQKSLFAHIVETAFEVVVLGSGLDYSFDIVAFFFEEFVTVNFSGVIYTIFDLSLQLSLDEALAIGIVLAVIGSLVAILLMYARRGH